MEEERKVRVYTCDNPKCGAEIIMQDESPADGYHGTVLHVGSWGGSGAKWFACRPEHIRRAIEGALARESEQP